MAKFIVQSASAKVPTSWRGIHRKVAVLEVHDHVERASMISEHSKDVIRVVVEYGPLRVGKTERSEYARHLALCEAMAAKLNGGQA